MSSSGNQGSVARSYKLLVDFRDSNLPGNKVQVQLNVAAPMPDLAVLLQALNDSSHVSAISIFSTVTIPSLHTFSQLTEGDLGLSELKKLK